MKIPITAPGITLVDLKTPALIFVILVTARNLLMVLAALTFFFNWWNARSPCKRV